MALSHYGNLPLKPFTKAGIILALLLIGPALNPVQLFSQTASIQGLVVDSTTGIPLEAAQILISDNVETATDRHGLYRFPNLPAGEHTLTVQMLGYSPKSIQVSLQPGGQSEALIRLQSNFPEGDRILVDSRMREQAQGLTRQQKSVNFNTVLPNKQMEAFGDRTVQDAITRIPGVHTGRHGEVNIRGTGFNRYNVMLDGRRLSTTGFGDRSVDLSGYSTDMVHQLEVIKVITPDMHADALGGLVNIRTQRPAGERYLSAYGGVGAQPIYYNYGGMGSRAGIHYSEALRDDLSLGLNLNYQMDNDSWESLDLDFDVADFGAGRRDVIRRVSPGLHANQRGRLAGGLQLNFNPSDRSVYHINAFYNDDNRTMDLHRNYWDTGGDWISPDTTGAIGGRGSYGYDARRQDHRVQQFAIQTGGKHWFDLFNLEYNLNWTAAHSGQEQYMFPFVRDGLNFSIDNQDRTRPVLRPQASAVKRDGTIDYRVTRFQQLERTINDHTDNTLSGNVDLDIPFGSASLKIGSSALLNYKKGEFRQASFSHNGTLDLYRFRMIPLADINVFNEDAYYIPWIMDTEGGRSFLEYNTPSFSKNENLERRNSEIWNYDHTESIISGYGMGTLHFGSFQLIGGVRIEHTIASYEGRDVEFDENNIWLGTSRVNSDRQFTHLFPHAQLAFMPSEMSSIRVAFSQSIARPDFNRLSPFSLTLRQDSTLFRGNPGLDPMTSDNLDLLVDHYYRGIGHVGIGVFYKRLTNFVVESSRTLTGGEFEGFTERGYFENTDETATLYGVEISWQHNLSFLPGILGNLGTFANYTWSQSEFDVDYRPGEDIRLPGHSPHIVNAALNYTRGRMFGQVSYHWTAESLIDLAESPEWAPAVSGNEQVYMDRYYGGASDLSIAFAFRISEYFRFWADASNLLQNERINYAHSSSVYPYTTDLRQGISFRSGFRFNL